MTQLADYSIPEELLAGYDLVKRQLAAVDQAALMEALAGILG